MHRGHPPTLAKVASRLAEGGVNVEALMPTSIERNVATVAFVTSDVAKAPIGGDDPDAELTS
jgi:hypothetical protein